MVGSTTAVRSVVGSAGFLDRLTAGRSASEEQRAVGGSATPQGLDGLLCEPEDSFAAPAGQSKDTISLDLQNVWFSLPEQDKVDFGGRFSQMVVRALQGLLTGEVKE